MNTFANFHDLLVRHFSKITHFFWFAEKLPPPRLRAYVALDLLWGGGDMLNVISTDTNLNLFTTAKYSAVPR